MEARKSLMTAFAVLLSIAAASAIDAASFRSKNFIATTADPTLAREVVQLAEKYRKELALQWLGHELPDWSQPCPITVNVGGGAGGATSFAFYNRVPMNWTMEIQGPRERILDSVLPHEILHTVFATHFGRPLPRWADEGACTTVEHASERNKNTDMLYRFLTSDRGIAFNRMFAMKEYPQDVLPLYAQGYSLARFLIAQGGKRKFVDFVGAGMDSNNWTRSLYEAYGFKSLGSLQVAWLDWVRLGSDPAKIQEQTSEVLLASHQQPIKEQMIARGQSPSPQDESNLARPLTAVNDPSTLHGRLVPVNHAYGSLPQNTLAALPTGAASPSNSGENLGDFYANGAQALSQPTSTVSMGRNPEPPSKNPVHKAAENKVLMQWSKTEVAAPAYYLPGGTSLYR